MVVVTDDGVPPLNDSEIFIITVTDSVAGRSSSSRFSPRTRTLFRGPFRPTSSTSAAPWMAWRLYAVDTVQSLTGAMSFQDTSTPAPGEGLLLPGARGLAAG